MSCSCYYQGYDHPFTFLPAVVTPSEDVCRNGWMDVSMSPYVHAMMIFLTFWMVSLGDSMAPLEDPKLFNGIKGRNCHHSSEKCQKFQVTSLSKSTQRCKYILR
ncbi:unnamed protein product [Sphenostylis stenocarpa]|uniref:Uncharacterized protein n=1 Tax=Sphenostylis stenocarpa TaxID=92480 RepID=A0AA86VV49_9FABA|nr:unnamed protein product [Sphenostylis stenocarpa]